MRLKLNASKTAACIWQSALKMGPSHCLNGHLGQDLGFGGFVFALKLPKWLNTNLLTVMAKLGQTPSFPNGPRIGLRHIQLNHPITPLMFCHVFVGPTYQPSIPARFFYITTPLIPYI